MEIMNTIILACSCDSLVDKVCAKLCACCPKIIEPCTNNADIAITAIICKSFVLIALIGMIGFLVWKLIELYMNNNADEKGKKKDYTENGCKLKSNLLDKYLDFLLEQTKDAKKDQQINIIQDIKEKICPDNSQSAEVIRYKNHYRQVLEYLIELSQKGKLEEISKEKMEEFFKQEKSTDNEGQNT